MRVDCDLLCDAVWRALVFYFCLCVFYVIACFACDVLCDVLWFVLMLSMFVLVFC